jgi:hypothetical protein
VGSTAQAVAATETQGACRARGGGFPLIAAGAASAAAAAARIWAARGGGLLRLHGHAAGAGRRAPYRPSPAAARAPRL